MAEQKQEQEEDDEYDGPWLEKRIEWKCPDRKRHNVVLFGSWNRFKGGDELEYQGKQVFACNVKLPLGTYVYRFLIDAEDWETHNNAGKTARNGIEYNQIHVTEDSDEEEEDEFADNAPQQEDNDGDGQNTTLMMGADGKLTMGKGKRRGRPSVELDLGQDFAANVEEEEPDDLDAPDEAAEDGNEADADTSGATSSDGKDKKKKKRARKKRDKKKRRGKKGDKEQDKEWAKYVFVQQLRLQQQHNDEINRVKTLWKQERQVRVEMHKKVLKQLKDARAKTQEQTVEIQRLTQTAQIGSAAESKLASQFKAQALQLQTEKEGLQQEIQKRDRDFADFRKSRIEDDKQNRQIKGDWEAKERKYQNESKGMQSQIKTLEQTQITLESNLNALKDGSAKTMELKEVQFAEREKQFAQEKEEYEACKKDLKKSKNKCKSLEQRLQESKDETASIGKRVSNEKKHVQSANDKIRQLEAAIDALKNSTEAAEKMQIEVNKVRAEKESENKILAERLGHTEKQLAEQKVFFEDKLAELDDNNQQQIAALQSKGDKQMNEVMTKLKGDIASKNEEITKNQEEIHKLSSCISEEKAHNDGLTDKINAMSDELLATQNSEDNLKKEYEALKSENSKQADEYKTLESESSQVQEEQESKIHALDNELNALKMSTEEESKSSEERTQTLEKQIEGLQNSINEKNEVSANLSQELSDASQEIVKYKNNEAALCTEVESLKDQIVVGQEEMTAKEKEYQQNMNTLQSDMEGELARKDAKLGQITANLHAKETQYTAKLEEFSNAEAKIQELRVNLNAEQQNLENERKNNRSTVAGYVAKEERTSKLCKSLFAKFTEIREEMKSVQEEQISQLEEVSKFFGDFGPLLAQVFKFNQAMIDDLLVKYKRELSLRRKYFNMVQDLRGNIRVFCRFRPLLPFELKKGYTECVKFPHEGALKIVDQNGKTLPFEFDQVYTPKTTQVQVSEDSTEYIQSVMDGYNVSIFAYGQTGSGKTYTMEGPSDNPGVNLRALTHLFKIMEERTPQFQYKIKLSIFEIYNEKINDLIMGAEEVLAGGKKKKKKKMSAKDKKKASSAFKIRHLPDGSVEVEGLTKVQVTSDEDIIKLNKIAKKSRSASATDMNAHSSRSHMLLVVYVSGINIPANLKYFGKLYLVDLAGSERVKKSGAVGQALKEAQNINKSLSALGDVMQALQQKAKFIPYRNSTLTDLMANALGGNAKTIMFINCCPASAHAFETVSSLKFAKRVGKVELGQAKKNTSKGK